MKHPKGYNLFEVTLWCILAGTLSTISLTVIEGIRDQQRLAQRLHLLRPGALRR